ncbi:MAG: hypothetical protein IJC26_00055, partial [Clostridia bacterium]|nr:hypothetical protein [Clostridia bacterium]
MKKIFALLLALALLIPAFVSCSSSLNEEPEETKTEEAEVKETKKTEAKEESGANYPEVSDKLSYEKINAFPLATNDMTLEERRKLCVDFFRFSQTFAWTPDEDHDFSYTLSGKTTKKTVEQGTVYGGLPYMRGTGNVYRIMEFYDPETGVVDMENAAANQLYFGNQCSIGASWGWARVVNSANYEWTSGMVASRGFVPVGEYTYDFSIPRFGNSKIISTDVCLKNGEQIMFRSYAQLKPADGLVYYTTAGHVIMCSSDPVVVKNADGTINGNESYITVIDQDTGWVEKKQTDGSPFMVQGSVDDKITFAKLFKGSYVPFTFPELLGTDPIEEVTCSFSIQGDTVNRNDLPKATVTSNYYISDVHLYVYDETGKEVAHKASRVSSAGRTEHTLGSSIGTSGLKKFA